MARTTIQFTDYSNEKSTVTVNGEELSAANFDAQATEASALSVAIGVLSIGSLTQRAVTNVILDSPDIPTNPFAQRELKWLVSYQGDTSGKKYSMEIPCAALTGNVVAGSDLADLTSTPWVNFIAAFEAYARAPDNLTETVSFISARVVGRNS